jgi:hypothetical protein
MRVTTLCSLVACAIQVLAPDLVLAQDPPPPIPLVVLDLRGNLPGFPRDRQLAASRGLMETELPGRGLGADLGMHLHVFKWKAMTVGIGGLLTVARATSARVEDGGQIIRRGVAETFIAATPQLSFNFGDGDGWSYISGGLGLSQWQVIAHGAGTTAADQERLRVVNYGGGARWFIKSHLAFTFDVRFHDIDPGSPQLGLPGSPRTRLIVMGAGISVR